MSTLADHLASPAAPPHPLAARWPHALLLENEQGEVVEANERFTQLFGVPGPAAELRGHARAQLAELMQDQLARPETCLEEMNRQAALAPPAPPQELVLRDGRRLLRHHQPCVLPDGQAGHLWEFEAAPGPATALTAWNEADLRMWHLINTAQDVAACFDAQGRVTDWNRLAEALFGWTNAQAVGRPLAELIIPPEHRAEHAASLAQFLGRSARDTIQRHQQPRLAQRQDGTRLWVDLAMAAAGTGAELRFSGIVRWAAPAPPSAAPARPEPAAAPGLERPFPSCLEAVLGLDAQGQVLELNAPAEQMLGWLREEAVGQSLFALTGQIPPASGPAPGAKWFKQLAETAAHERRRVQLLIRRRDGTSFPAEVSLASGSIGDKLVYSALVLDISRRRAAEFNLKRELQFNAVMAALALHMNRAGLVEEVVSGALALVRQQYPALTLAFYAVPPGQRCRACGACVACEGRSQSPGQAELPARLEAGTPEQLLPELERQWPAAREQAERQWLPVVNETQLLGHLLVCTATGPAPLTPTQLDTLAHALALGIKRKQDHRELRRLQLAIESAFEGIALLDTEEKFVYLNPAYARLCGYASPAELEGKHWHVLYSPAVTAQLEQEVRPALRQTGHWHGCQTGLRKDGTEFPKELDLTVLPDGGLLCLIQDNSERLNALESLRTANAALQRSARFKDEVLANMSHELRTPLNAIIGMSECLQLETYGQLNERQGRSVEMILSSARHLAELIGDILDLAKIEAGKLVPQKHPVDVKRVTDLVTVMFRQRVALKKQSLVVQVPEGLPPLITDERRLKQILVNLLDNAIKFTPDGRAVGLEVRRDEAAQRWLLTVWDEGIGIPAADQARLFQPFVQLDTGFARQYAGTGLGLALVQRLSEMLGGTVHLVSQEARGARFTLSLPDEAPRPAAAAPGAGAAALAPVLPVATRRDRKPLVLLVEDHPPNAEMLQTFLLAIGYRVTHAKSGADALAAAARERPDVVLMDIQMPEMDGLEATARLRANAATATVPVLAVTALAMPDDRARCEAAGMNDYFAKPLKLRELAATLEKWAPQTTPR